MTGIVEVACLKDYPGSWAEYLDGLYDPDPEAARGATQNHMGQPLARFSAGWRSTRKNAARRPSSASIPRTTS